MKLNPILSVGIAALLVSATCASAKSKNKNKGPKPVPSIELTAIGSVAAGSFESSAAEIVAYDPATQRVFVVNAQAAQIDIVDIHDPSNPAIIDSLDVTPYGAVANSVAVHGNLIAVAVEANPKTDPGQVVFFDTNTLDLIDAVPVGALPDMLTFTPDGRYVLVANEGEPNDDYDVDPEGSVTVIEITKGGKNKMDRSKAAKSKSKGGKGSPEFIVRTADFLAFNGTTLDSSVRIFGPNATVAQDLEPEYIAISSDSRTAYVTCQENNAIAVVDIPSATVTEIRGLGFKDHAAVQASTSIFEFDPANMPSIGTTVGGQQIGLGGFSGLHFEGIDSVTGRYKFIANTDRGPNAEPTGLIRPFLLPDFAPELVRFELDRTSGELTLTQRIALQKSVGVPLTGLPNTAISGSASAPYNDEVPVDLHGNTLPLDPLGADLEGVVTDPGDGTFWMVDEYRPAIYHFDTAGVLLERIVPIGTAAAASQTPGFFGTEALPAVLAQRRQNRGFEGVAFDHGKVYAFVQSPLRNPVSLANGALNAMRNIRIVEFDPIAQTTRQYLYIMDNADLGGGDNTRADKIGDAVSFGNGEFLVIERDDDKISSDLPEQIEKKIYRFNLQGATDISGLDGNIGSTNKTVDQLTVEELVANNIHPVEKILHLDLNAAGYNQVEKVEGLTLIDARTLAVINDNDFGVANITTNPEDGTFVLNYVPEKTQLGVIDFRANGLDASDKDDQINIRPWPVKGIYMPDSIARFNVGKQEYLITANEGDARDYDGFSEVERIGKLDLDPVLFPNADVLQNDSNLGRLNITTTMGFNAMSGYFEELYSFGARSFTIWSTSGERIFDSGDDLEMITAKEAPEAFNVSNSNNTFDNRSDDKGPEPEGVTVGEVKGRTYAFVGLERVGGIMVYDITDPQKPVFVQWANNRDYAEDVETPAAGDLGPEGLIFINEKDSPIKQPLIVVGNEVSGTTTIYRIDPKTTSAEMK